MRSNCISNALCFLKITAKYQDCPVCSVNFYPCKFYPKISRKRSHRFCSNFTNIEAGIEEKSSDEQSWKKNKNTAASRQHNITQLKTNFHLCLIQLRWSFSYIFVNGDVNLGGIGPEKSNQAIWKQLNKNNIRQQFLPEICLGHLSAAVFFAFYLATTFLPANTSC